VRTIGETLTDEAGQYRFQNVWPGDYALHIERYAGPCPTGFHSVFARARTSTKAGVLTNVPLVKVDLELRILSPMPGDNVPSHLTEQRYRLGEVSVRWEPYPGVSRYTVEVAHYTGSASSAAPIVRSSESEGEAVTIRELPVGSYWAIVKGYAADGRLISEKSAVFHIK
jgi:hypothetical protein